MKRNNKKIKALQIITLFSIGGATETVVSIAEGLMKKGYKIDILTGPHIKSEGSMYDKASKLNIPVFTKDYLKRDINIFTDFLTIFKLYWFIRQNKYDIVHTHSSKAGVVGRIAAKLAGVKIVIHTVHGLPFHRYQTTVKRNFYIWVEKISALFCNKIIAVTHTIIDEFERLKIAERTKMVMIRSSFDLTIFSCSRELALTTRKRFSISENDFVVGKIARLSPLKGHRFLLESLSMVKKELPKIKVLIVGDGELQEELETFVQHSGLNENVIFSGLIPPEGIPEIINCMDVVVHTSLLEGLARVLPQSIMLQKPIISFDLDGAHEVIQEGETGYLIEPQNINQLADRIIELGKDSNKANEFGRRGKELLGNEFCEKKMIDETDILYTRLMKDRNSE